MSKKVSYNTKQKKALLDYLEKVPGKHVTVNDICSNLKKMNISMGQTTVYRQLEKMVDEGLVNKYIVDVNSPACFEYIPADTHADEHICFHCKCEKCGKIIHLHCDDLEKIGIHLFKKHNFEMDTKRTVIYGLCSDCYA